MGDVSGLSRLPDQVQKAAGLFAQFGLRPGLPSGSRNGLLPQEPPGKDF